MDIENRLNENHKDAPLENSLEAEKNLNMLGDQEDLEKSGGDQNAKTVPFLKLFSFADFTDVVLMIVGTLGAIGNGLGMPLLTVFFGEMINVIGSNQNSKGVIQAVSKVKRHAPQLARSISMSVNGMVQLNVSLCSFLHFLM